MLLVTDEMAVDCEKISLCLRKEDDEGKFAAGLVYIEGNALSFGPNGEESFNAIDTFFKWNNQTHAYTADRKKLGAGWNTKKGVK